jgi:phosphatidylserine synthase
MAEGIIMAEKKDLFIVRLKFADLLILMVFAIGVLSTYNSNRNQLNAALAALFAATILYFIASTYARHIGGGAAVGFTRALNGFVSGMVFLVAPCIFMYHWHYNGIFESAVLMVFMLAGIVRIAAFEHFGTREDVYEYYYTGMPVFWSPAITAVFYVASKYISRTVIHPALSATLLIFSFLMVLNTDLKFLHKPRSWAAKNENKKI